LRSDEPGRHLRTHEGLNGVEHYDDDSSARFRICGHLPHFARQILRNEFCSAMSTPTLGKPAPAFSLPSTSGTVFTSKDAAGKNLVLYFYPKDNTPGCTQEGADFAALAAALKKTNTVIVGISGDSLVSHAKFKAKMKFPFELLADEERAVCKLYDVIREKNLYGRKFMGIERSTFLIDARGVLRHEWRKVKVKGHAAEVLTAAQML
jgi:peroxiredoxin Q/BCP